MSEEVEPTRVPASVSSLPGWKLEDAKARFSELVRSARERGPQRVTVRGQDAVVILSAADYARLAPLVVNTSLASLFGDGPFARLDGFDEKPIGDRSRHRDAPAFDRNRE